MADIGPPPPLALIQQLYDYRLPVDFKMYISGNKWVHFMILSEYIFIDFFMYIYMYVCIGM